MKVVKFGGSSLADAAQFRRVKEIIKSDPYRRAVVVSASGKRSSSDAKITDLLYLTHAHLNYGVSPEDIFRMIETRYYGIRDELGLKYDLESEFQALRAKLDKGLYVDYLVSRGEYLTARLMAEYLGYAFLDAAECVFFDYDGQIDYPKTYGTIAEKAMNNPHFVMPGFYGSMPNGRIRVMTRGGSDISGAIVANALDAEIYENWTDVSGILMADPKVVKDPRPIKYITYQELRELSHMGASVLHEESILPVKEKNIPLNIRNTNRPQDPGTMILQDVDSATSGTSRLITGISGRKNFTSMTIYEKRANADSRIIQKVLEMLDVYGVDVEHMSIGVDSFNVVMPTAQVDGRIYDIISDIKRTLKPQRIKVEDDIALIACVGRSMVSVPGSCARLFAALGENRINIRMIVQGSEEISVIVGVDNKDFERTIRVLYDGFMNEGGNAK